MTGSDTPADHLAQHPRLIGMLVAASLLLSQAGSAFASHGGTIGGP